MTRLPRAAAFGVGLAILAIAPSVARAHDVVEVVSAAVPIELPAHALSAAPTPPALPGAIVLALVVLFALASLRPRRALGLALALVLSAFAFENALHSVHHLDDRQAATHCTIAVTGAQLHGTAVDTVAFERRMAPAFNMAAPSDVRAPAAPTLMTFFGRAPPLPA